MTLASIDPARVRDYLLELQQRIVSELERLDGRPFAQDRWDKPADSGLSGSGITRILEEGGLFERAGVGFEIALQSQHADLLFSSAVPAFARHLPTSCLQQLGFVEFRDIDAEHRNA